MRVALFGGSFNPPHVAHQMAALYVLETAPVDALWFVPAFEHAFGKPLVAFDDRLAMCGLAAAALGPRVRVSDVEREIGGRSLTLRTVRRLMDLHPEHAFSHQPSDSAGKIKTQSRNRQQRVKRRGPESDW